MHLNYINIYEEISGELTCRFNFKQKELLQAFEKLKIIDNSHLFVLGTLVAKEGTSPNGRLIIAYLKDGKVNQIKAQEYLSPVMNIKLMKEDVLICCIGSQIKILQLHNKGIGTIKSLLEEVEIKVLATKDINTTIHSMDTCTDNLNYFACADPLKHLRIYEYDPDAGKII